MNNPRKRRCSFSVYCGESIRKRKTLLHWHHGLIESAVVSMPGMVATRKRTIVFWAILCWVMCTFSEVCPVIGNHVHRKGGTLKKLLITNGNYCMSGNTDAWFLMMCTCSLEHINWFLQMLNVRTIVWTQGEVGLLLHVEKSEWYKQLSSVHCWFNCSTTSTYTEKLLTAAAQSAHVRFYTSARGCSQKHPLRSGFK